jgi:hypothetical protein
MPGNGDFIVFSATLKSSDHFGSASKADESSACRSRLAAGHPRAGELWIAPVKNEFTRKRPLRLGHAHPDNTQTPQIPPKPMTGPITPVPFARLMARPLFFV